MSLPKTDDAGVVQTTETGTPVSWNAGLGYDVDGNLCIYTVTDITDTFVGGKRVTADGRLLVVDSSLGGQPFNYNAGWPSDKNTGMTIRQTGTPSPTDPLVAGVAIGPLGGVYMSEGGSLCVPISIVDHPVISGSGEVGSTLYFEGGDTYAGTQPHITMSPVWYVDATPVIGGFEFVVLAEDVGKTITARVRASNPCGQVDNYSNGIVAVPETAWTPIKLFENGEKGVWYDPSDFSTMFQDAAGTIPVTAVEQPVGLILDKSGNNNHATQSVSTARPTLGARQNLLVATEVLSTQSVNAHPTQYTITFEGTGSVAASGAYTGALTNGTTFPASEGVLTLTVSGSVTKAQLVYGVEAKPYQRVNTATDYDTDGFPLYLYFDGVDDGVSVPLLDLTLGPWLLHGSGIEPLKADSAGFFASTGNPMATAFGEWFTAVSGPDGNQWYSTVIGDGTSVGLPVAGSGTWTGNAPFPYFVQSVFRSNANLNANSNDPTLVAPIAIDGVIWPSIHVGYPVTGSAFANAIFYLGRNPSEGRQFLGNIYEYVLRNTTATSSGIEMDNLDQWISEKMTIVTPPETSGFSDGFSDGFGS